MINSTILKYLLSATLAVSVLYSMYDYVYDRGYAAKTLEVETYQRKQSENIAALSKTLANLPAEVVLEYDKVYGSVLDDIKNKPLYIVSKDGKCQPSKDFEKAYRSLLK